MNWPIRANNWTDERVEQLRKMCADGLSASEMANELGGITRNAVIGKARRCGFAFIVKPGKPKQGPKPRHLRILTRKPWARPRPDITPGPPAEPDQITDLPPEPVANPVTLLELAFHHCCWPVDVPLGPMMYCGADKLGGHSYCRRHCDVAYSKPVAMTRAELEVRTRHMAKMRKARAA